MYIIRRNILSNTFVLLLLTIYISQTVQKEHKDHYRTLGVKKSADKKEIRDGFKKKSRTYHPDKNPEDPEKAKEKFQEIAEAYEVLKDPEQKRIYDLGGDPNDHQGHQAHYHGGGFQGHHNFHGGNRRYTYYSSSGGGHRFYHDSDQFFDFDDDFFQEPDNPFDGTSILQISNIKQLMSKTEPVILLCTPKQAKYNPRSKQIVDLSKRLKEFMKVAIINCPQYRGIEYNQAMLYQINKNRGNQVIYKGEIEQLNLYKFISNNLKHSVTIIEDEREQEFFELAPYKIKIILITDKEEISLAFKILSENMKEFSFGYIRKSSSSLISKLQIHKFPRILILQQNNISPRINYPGKNHLSEIREYLNKFKKSLIKYPFEGEFRELTFNLYMNNFCGRKDSFICILLLMSTQSDPITQKYMKELDSLARKFTRSRLRLMWVEGATQPQFIAAFGNITQGIVVLKPDKQKFSVLRDFTTINIDTKNTHDDNLEGNLDKLVQGQFKIENNLYSDAYIIKVFHADPWGIFHRIFSTNLFMIIFFLSLFSLTLFFLKRINN